MGYSWREEVASIRRQAEILRLRAADERYEAEKRAAALEADATRMEMRADGIQRLCSRNGKIMDGQPGEIE